MMLVWSWCNWLLQTIQVLWRWTHIQWLQHLLNSEPWASTRPSVGRWSGSLVLVWCGSGSWLWYCTGSCSSTWSPPPPQWWYPEQLSWWAGARSRRRRRRKSFGQWAEQNRRLQWTQRTELYQSFRRWSGPAVWWGWVSPLSQSMARQLCLWVQLG